MKFVISTQYIENDNCNNPGEGEDYFKFKGGSDYIVSGFDRVQDAVVFVLDIHCCNNLGCKEFPSVWGTYEEWAAKLPKDPEYRAFVLETARKVSKEAGPLQWQEVHVATW